MNLKYEVDKNKWLIITVLAIIILGVIFHYVYEWSNENKIIGYFTPVSESVWEHLKLIVIPLIIISLIQYYANHQNNVGLGVILGSLVGMLIIVMVFYTYVGAITHPKTYIAIDIGTFVVAAIAAGIVATIYFKKEQYSQNVAVLSWIGIAIIVIAFAAFSYNTPDLPIFEELLEV